MLKPHKRWLEVTQWVEDVFCWVFFFFLKGSKLFDSCAFVMAHTSVQIPSHPFCITRRCLTFSSGDFSFNHFSLLPPLPPSLLSFQKLLSVLTYQMTPFLPGHSCPLFSPLFREATLLTILKVSLASISVLDHRIPIYLQLTTVAQSKHRERTDMNKQEGHLEQMD